jgi:Mat/Ecp fimbriae outer membrane usher protein
MHLRPAAPAFLLLAAGAPVAMAQDAPPPPASKPVVVSSGMPSDFADLDQAQNLVADVFFGDTRIGQFNVESRPGQVRFTDPAKVAAGIPNLVDADALTRALTGTLDANARFLCTPAASPCEVPQPEVAAIVFDPQRFRIDLYLNARLLAVRATVVDPYLKPHGKGLSFVDILGGAVAGGDGQTVSYNFYNRAILGAGNARLASEASLSSGRGFDVDTLAAQLDGPGVRYMGGLFYAPGADLVGRRRILGVGLTSQFDTRIDRMQLFGSPLIVFLGQRSRVDIYVEGRLVSSRNFEAGNQALDTSGLPDGSYPVEIRIQETSGATRVERRFFTKSAAIAPVGHLSFFAHAGLLAVDRRNHWLSVSKVPLLTAGLAGRVGTSLAWDTNLMVTDRKGLAEAGLTHLSPNIQTRLALLASSVGDYGVVGQSGSTAGGAFSYNIDLRYVHSAQRGPLIPLDDYVGDLLSSPDLVEQSLHGTGTSFTQAIGNLAWRIGDGQLGVSAYLRHDQGRASSYAIGPTVRWTLLRRQQFQLIFNGAYAATNRGRTFALGLQLQVLRRRSSFGAQAGVQTGLGARGDRLNSIQEVSASIHRDKVLGGDFDASGTLQHSSSDGTILQASASERNAIGFASASLVHRTGATGSASQYALSAQTSLAAGGGIFHIGARDQNESVINVGVHGSAHVARFQILVDDEPRGEVVSGGRLSLALTPYRRYRVRIHPIGRELVSFDAQARTVDVYPGTVAVLDWKADTVLAMFGRLVWPDGSPVANADIVTDGAIAATDQRGYFQLQAAGNAEITAHMADGRTCRARLDAKPSQNEYSAIGDVPCRP